MTNSDVDMGTYLNNLMARHKEAEENTPGAKFFRNRLSDERAQPAYDALIDSPHTTADFVKLVLNNMVYGTDDVALWGGVAGSREEAKEYYDSIEDEDELRSEAASILAYGNWNRKKVGFKFS